MLDELIKVKQLREDKAIAALNEAQTLLEQRASAEEAKRQEQADYSLWRTRRKQELYQDIEGKSVSLKELEQMREQIESYRDRDLQLQDELVEAGRERESAQQAMETARQVRLSAYREVAKYEQYNQTLVDEEQREQERREEVEVEDMNTGRSSVRKQNKRGTLQ